MKKSTLRKIVAIGLLIVCLLSVMVPAVASAHTHHMHAYAETYLGLGGPVWRIKYWCDGCSYYYYVYVGRIYD